MAHVTTPPTSSASAAEEDATRYDRQVRLWGQEAQQRLEKSSVCVIHGSAAGTEVLKNLVLPGVGSFTLVDGSRATPQDCGSNFFVTAQSASSGASRACCATTELAELNPRVRGLCVDECLERVLDSRPDFFDRFSAVVATQTPSGPTLARLAARLAKARVPLVVVRSYGLVGVVRVAACPEVAVLDARPDSPAPDLRALNPFPRLLEFARGFDLSQMDSAQHSHVPFVVLLILALDRWRQADGSRRSTAGCCPTTRAEKDEFKATIKSMARNFGNEANFQEAVAAAHRCFAGAESGKCTDEILQVLDDPRAAAPKQNDDEFWVMAAALREFVRLDNGGFLPLHGGIPDMVAHTETYVALQKVYQAQADADIQKVTCRCDAICERLKRPHIPLCAIRSFCKNSAFIRLIKYDSLAAEEEEAGQQSTKHLRPWTSFLDAEKTSPFVWYVALQACDAFHAKTGRWPGMFVDDHVEADIKPLRDEINAILQKHGLPAEAVGDDYVHEICRWGGAELHVVSAFVGGVAAQEVIKLLTKCFVPLDNTLVFDGIRCTSTTIRM